MTEELVRGDIVIHRKKLWRGVVADSQPSARGDRLYLIAWDDRPNSWVVIKEVRRPYEWTPPPQRFPANGGDR